MYSKNKQTLLLFIIQFFTSLVPGLWIAYIQMQTFIYSFKYTQNQTLYFYIIPILVTMVGICAHFIIFSQVLIYKGRQQISQRVFFSGCIIFFFLPIILTISSFYIVSPIKKDLEEKRRAEQVKQFEEYRAKDDVFQKQITSHIAYWNEKFTQQYEEQCIKDGGMPQRTAITIECYKDGILLPPSLAVKDLTTSPNKADLNPSDYDTPNIPRIMYWSSFSNFIWTPEEPNMPDFEKELGKVHQHWNLEMRRFETDPDGISGVRAFIPRLDYCKKWYPNTVSVREYKKEVSSTWSDEGNIGNRIVGSTSFECVQS